jgi:hypothetical protein
MAKILITAIARQSPVPQLSPAVTSFINGYFSFGDQSGFDTGLVTFNRVMSKSTIGTESTRTAMSTAARESQNAGGFSSTDIYHIKGYSGALATTVNKVLAASDSQSTPTIAFTLERRGPMGPCPLYLGRIYFHGGYSDTLASYRQETTYITTSTDTPTDDTSLTAARHVGSALFNTSSSWLIGGYTSGGATTTLIYKWIFSSSSISTLAATDVTNAQGYGLNYLTFGYRANGRSVTNTSNRKLTFATDTISTGSDSPEAGLTVFQGTSFVTSSSGYAWTGNKSVGGNRLLHQLVFATETWSNLSYNTLDSGSGYIQGTSGY